MKEKDWQQPDNLPIQATKVQITPSGSLSYQ